jgi:hypothetical protein
VQAVLLSAAIRSGSSEPPFQRRHIGGERQAGGISFEYLAIGRSGGSPLLNQRQPHGMSPSRALRPLTPLGSLNRVSKEPSHPFHLVRRWIAI